MLNYPYVLCACRASGAEGWSPHVSDSRTGRLGHARLSGPWKPQPCATLAAGWKSLAAFPPTAGSAQRILGHLQNHCKYNLSFPSYIIQQSSSVIQPRHSSLIDEAPLSPLLTPLLFMSQRTMERLSSFLSFICSPLRQRNRVRLSCSVALPPKSDSVQSEANRISNRGRGWTESWMFPDSAPLSSASNLVRSLTAAVIAEPAAETFSQTDDWPSHRAL